MKSGNDSKIMQTQQVITKPQQSERNLLIVDDDEFILDVLEAQLRTTAYNIFSSLSAQSGLEIIKANPINVIISDQTMPGMDGITFFKEVRKFDEDVVLIMLTGNGTLDHAMTAINELRVFSYILKPCSMPMLKSTIKDAFKHYEVTTEYKRILKRTYHSNEQLTRQNRQLNDCISELMMELEKSRAAKS